MRLFIYHRDFPADARPPTAGVCKSVNGLALALSEAGHQVIVICQGEADSTVQRGPNYQVRCFAGQRGGPLGIDLPETLKQYVHDNAHDALYLLNAMFHRGVYALSALLRRERIPYIVAPHDPYHPVVFSRKPAIKWPYWYLFERPMLRHAAAVQVLDRRHAEYLKRLGVMTPTIECINGYSPADEVPESELHWSTDGRATAVFVGRIDANNKGLDLLVEAVSQLEPELRPQLTLQGPEWGDGAALRLQADRLGISDLVKVLPPDYTVTSGRIMARHDIFCLTSRFEGFGLAALEAMLAGRVMMVSDIAGIAPFVRAAGCGVVVDPDVRSVREGFIALQKRRAHWPAMGRAGRDYVLQNLRWDKIAPPVWKQYNALLASPDSAGSNVPRASIA